MENIINLEQLNYRDQMIKQYVDDYSGASSNNLMCNLEVDVDMDRTPRAKLYLRSYKGEIFESDTLQFARNTSTPTYWVRSGSTKKVSKRRRGWIIPNDANVVKLYKVYDANKSNDIYDYWEILPKNHIGVNKTWEQLIDEFLSYRNQHLIDPYNTEGKASARAGYSLNYSCFVNRWCGVAVVRNGKNITKYMNWMVAGPKKSGGNWAYKQFQSSYDVMGNYLDSCGPETSPSGEVERVYAYGLRVK